MKQCSSPRPQQPQVSSKLWHWVTSAASLLIDPTMQQVLSMALFKMLKILAKFQDPYFGKLIEKIQGTEYCTAKEKVLRTLKVQ